MGKNPAKCAIVHFLAITHIFDLALKKKKTFLFQESECVGWQVQVPPNLVNNQAPNKPYRIIPTGKKVGNSRSGSPRDGLGFHINFPIEVTQLGLSKRALNAYFNRFKHGNVTIELIDATNREVLTMMNFGYNDLKIPSDDGFMYKTIDAENLHKGFEGLLRIRPSETWKTVDKVNLTCNIDWNHVFGDDGPIIWRSSYIGK